MSQFYLKHLHFNCTETFNEMIEFQNSRFGAVRKL